MCVYKEANEPSSSFFLFGHFFNVEKEENCGLFFPLVKNVLKKKKEKNFHLSITSKPRRGEGENEIFKKLLERIFCVCFDLKVFLQFSNKKV